MSYYFLYQKKGIPSFLAYSILLLLILGLGFFLYQNTGTYRTKASKYVAPHQVTTSNITNESASVSFITKQKASSFIKYGPDSQIDIIKFDDRDKEKPINRQIHYFSLHQLKPNTQYSFKINVNNQESSNNKTYQFRTLGLTQTNNTQAPIFGKAVNQKLEPETGVLVTATLSEANYAFSTLNRSTGEWIIPFPIVVNSLLKEYELADSDVINLTLTGPQLTQSKVKTRYKDSQPVKTIVLGKNYDLTKTGQTLGADAPENSNSIISSPRNNSIISSQYPVFRGVASPRAVIQLSLVPALFSTSVTASATGGWSYTVQNPLPPEKYQLIVVDRNNQSQAKLSFQIAKSGETVLGEATPSATTIPSPTLIPSPTIEPTVPTEPTATPTQIDKAGLNNNLMILFASGLSLFGLFLLLY